MSGYYGNRSVNRYWKRPKPRVYDCNIRDAERFYQQSYKEYLEAKESAAKKASADRLRSGDDYLSSIGYKRSNSLFDTFPDSLNSNILGNKSDLLDSGKTDFSSDTYSRFSSKNRIVKSPENDLNMIDERIQRIQNLRANLGLPDENSIQTRVRFQDPITMNEEPSFSNFKSREKSPEIRSRRGKTVDVTGSYSFTSQTNGFSKPLDMNSEKYERKFSAENGIESKYASNINGDDYSSNEGKYKRFGRQSSYANDDLDKYSVKSQMKIGKRRDYMDDSPSYLNDGLEKYSVKSYQKTSKHHDYLDDMGDNTKSYASKSDLGSSSFKTHRKTSEKTLDNIDDYDDDALLSNIRKKFPTSDEIMERINKMDSDL